MEHVQEREGKFAGGSPEQLPVGALGVIAAIHGFPRGAPGPAPLGTDRTWGVLLSFAAPQGFWLRVKPLWQQED